MKKTISERGKYFSPDQVRAAAAGASGIAEPPPATDEPVKRAMGGKFYTLSQLRSMGGQSVSARRAVDHGVDVASARSSSRPNPRTPETPAPNQTRESADQVVNRLLNTI